MEANNKTARLAGLLYLLMAAPAPFYLIYVPRTLIVRDDAATTASRILAHETLFRSAIVAELTNAILFILLAMVLYRLLNRVNKMHAALMVIYGGVLCAPIAFVNAANEIAALTLLRAGEFAAVFNQPQREALAMIFLRAHGQVILVEQILWGLWLIPFGLLVMRSGFLPRILGVLLIINSFPYILASLTALLAPDYAYTALNRYAVILELGELWIMLWLLIKGAKVEPIPAAVAHATLTYS